MRMLVLATAMLALSACAAKEDVPAGGPLGLGTKAVICKVAPSTLVAADGTMCTITPLRFREIQIGEAVTCTWQLGPGCPESSGP
jgi:hypothetical protein